jgi:hypothetical protein
MPRSGSAANRIGDADILIGVSALTHALAVVTNNEDHFRRIPGLQVENCLEEPRPTPRGRMLPMRKRTVQARRGAQSKRSGTALARRIAALPAAKRAVVADFVERLLDDDRQLVAAAERSSEAVFGRIWDNPDDAEYDRL